MQHGQENVNRRCEDFMFYRWEVNQGDPFVQSRFALEQISMTIDDDLVPPANKTRRQFSKKGFSTTVGMRDPTRTKKADFQMLFHDNLSLR